MILVIPDIHGRTFWKEPCSNINKYEQIVFLGDYLDPYDFENISVESAISNFKEIIEFAKANLNKVVLLLGNHDFYYYYKVNGVSRWSRFHHKEIENIFDENRNMFKIAYETDYTLFTHAGYLTQWADVVNKYFNEVHYELTPTAESLNKLLSTDLKYKNNNLGYFWLNMIPRERGGYSSYGSCIWADFAEHQWNIGYNGKFQVFGHTLQLDLYDYYKTYDESKISDGTEKICEEKTFFDENDKPYTIPGYAMVDCRHAFEYDEKNKSFNKL